MPVELEPPTGPDTRTASSACAVDIMVTIPIRHSQDATAAQLAEFFTDDHVHAAVLVDDDGVLVSVVERADLVPQLPAETSAARLGALAGRVVDERTELAEVWRLLNTGGRRRLAVTDRAGRLLGLICLTRRGTGFCSDADVAARAAERMIRPD